MTCSSCGATLPPGATSCPVCGMATPYNARSGGSGQYDPTIAVPYGNSPTPPPAPGTNYGSNPYNAPPNQYNNPYGAPPPQESYGTPPPQPYGAPQQQPYGVPQGIPPIPQQPYSPPPQKKSHAGRIALIIVGVVLLVVLVTCSAIGFALYQGGKSIVTSVNATATAVSNTFNTPVTGDTPPTGSTPTTAPSSGPPSGNQIDSTAASIITNPQMATGVDSNDHPTNITTSFTTGQQIYATLSVSSGASGGYVTSKWYGDGQLLHTGKILQVPSGGGSGYFTTTYTAAASGVVELYWCTQADCSDAKLGAFTSFTVS